MIKYLLYIIHMFKVEVTWKCIFLVFILAGSLDLLTNNKHVNSIVQFDVIHVNSSVDSRAAQLI